MNKASSQLHTRHSNARATPLSESEGGSRDEQTHAPDTEGGREGETTLHFFATVVAVKLLPQAPKKKKRKGRRKKAKILQFIKKYELKPGSRGLRLLHSTSCSWWFLLVVLSTVADPFWGAE
jgi:hypothetical protein